MKHKLINLNADVIIWCKEHDFFGFAFELLFLFELVSIILTLLILFLTLPEGVMKISHAFLLGNGITLVFALALVVFNIAYTYIHNAIINYKAELSKTVLHKELRYNKN